MNEDSLIEDLKRQVFEAERKLKNSKATSTHLSYENESLYTENSNFEEEMVANKSKIQKLSIKTKRLQGDKETIEMLKSLNEELSVKRDNLKSAIEKTVNEGKELSKPSKAVSNSPNIKLKNTLKKYEEEIVEICEENKTLKEKIREQEAALNRLGEEVVQETEVLRRELREYTEQLVLARKEKDDAENEYMLFQADVHQPDFARRGNSLYVEVVDRHELVKKVLNQCQDEMIRQRHHNRCLLSFLADVFDEFVNMKEEDFRDIMKRIADKIDRLQSEKDALEARRKAMEKTFEEEYKSVRAKYERESIMLTALVMEGSVIKMVVNSLEAQRLELETALKKMTDGNEALVAECVGIFKGNASLMTNIADLESKLVCYDREIPEAKKAEYETNEKSRLLLEQSKNEEVSERPTKRRKVAELEVVKEENEDEEIQHSDTLESSTEKAEIKDHREVIEAKEVTEIKHSAVDAPEQTQKAEVVWQKAAVITHDETPECQVS